VDIVYAKSFWEMDMESAADPMDAFVARVAADGFDGTEMFLPLISDPPQRVLELHEKYGLSHRIIDIVTEGDSPADHRTSFDAAFERALAYQPDLINSHTGRDIFSFADNVALYRHAAARSADAGVALVHETHRYRPTYSTIETRRYLEAVPDLLLNADLSHWMVVHESDLSDQEDNVEIALQRSRHIHARVGFEEGPQVNDPRAPEWAAHVERHIELWRRVVDHCRTNGLATLAITPEFGPHPYVPTLPYTVSPVVDVWEVNVFMKDMLRDRLAPHRR
jgi:sugar phosphate isomerase/epimerase